MYTEFHTKASALDESFLKSIKELFKSKKISIVVTEELDETEYLMQSEANKKMLLESMKSTEGYEFSAKEFSKLNSDLLNGKKINTSKLRKVKSLK